MNPLSFQIPEHELEISTSRAGGPGGQHVNKTESRVTVKWHIATSQILTNEQKERIQNQLASRITDDGFISVSSSQSRSQQHNKKTAIDTLHQLIIKALTPRQKRKRTGIPYHAKEKRVFQKRQRGLIKKIRSGKDFE